MALDPTLLIGLKALRPYLDDMVIVLPPRTKAWMTISSASTPGP